MSIISQIAATLRYALVATPYRPWGAVGLFVVLLVQQVDSKPPNIIACGS